MKQLTYVLLLCLLTGTAVQAQKKSAKPSNAVQPAATLYETAGEDLRSVKFRSIGPFRGGRSVTATGVKGNPLVYYMGTTGGGVWKTENAGQTWFNISDGYFNTGSVGAVAVSESDINVIYVGMGEHAPRGVMTSYGDGVYKSTDAGKTWKQVGLKATEQISWIRIHPTNPDIVYVAAQGNLYGPNPERGVYKSVDGGTTWKQVLFVDNSTGCADLDIDVSNPRVLYAAMWDHQRYPWEVRSGGKGSGLYKSVDGGETWDKIEQGIPKQLGKMSVSISRANPNKVYALIESDWDKEQGGLYISNDAGASFFQASKDHRLTQRAWYYVEVFADPQDENTVYVLNSPGLKSVDAGKTWTYIRGTHGDYHQLWINPANNQNQIIANDGGAAVTFNAGGNWSTQSNQPTAQFYRINVDNQWPYHIYAGQQDNTSVKIMSSNPAGWSISEREWTYSAGGESAFLAFDPNNPRWVMGGSYQGTIELLDTDAKEGKGVMVAPIQYQALMPKDMKYRFNWNAPIIYSMHEANTFYHAGNVLFKTNDGGKTWAAVSPDLTRNDKSKQGMSGTPFTNEGAGGENYGTIAYVTESKHEKGVMYTGSDDGFVQLTKDGGINWKNVTPANLEECLINSIEVSPHDKATVYIAATTYKFNSKQPILYKSNDYGTTWTKIVNGIPDGAYTRVIREDDTRKGLLFAGTETGLYVSWNDGANWQQLQLGLPVTPVTDLRVHQNNLIAATMGRSFWVLDDLHMLRQYKGRESANGFAIYKPNDVIRTSSGSMLDGEYDPAAKEIGAATLSAGVNAASGVVVYYQLSEDLSDSATLYLDVIDDIGKVVRTYSSKADPEFVSFPGGPDADPVLPASKGLHRFVWDLRHPTLKGVPRVFIEGSYQGRKVAPGAYLLRLRVAGKEATTQVRVLPHPKITATKAEYAEQQQWQKKVEDDINDIHQSVLNMRKVRQQVAGINERLAKNAVQKTLYEQGQAIVKKLQQWEDELVQNKAQSNDDIINFVNKLSADYIFLRGEMDANIPYVTKGQKEQFDAMHALWEKQKVAMHQMLANEIAAFNKLYQQAGLPAVLLPE
ncbi:WD40/YVTN/BNR-like repeat-containing protein [Phnomibacter sp. MR]|uniref:WD40/YVTN/BNR-like repeat-containing protein n=1 Tax=Phnomibacter sp. MR TaxID=3042318 RepID=UPI003A811876